MAFTAKGSLMIEVGAGELIDKITILKIKADRMTDAAKLRNVSHELEVLSCRSEIGRLVRYFQFSNRQYGCHEYGVGPNNSNFFVETPRNV